MPRSNPQTELVNSAINRLADRQWGVVARRQLIQLGISAECIKSRVRLGFMCPVDRGVYYVGRGSMGEKAIWMAAILSAGETAVLCGRSAAVLLGFMDQDLVIDVRCPQSRRRFNTRIRPPVGRFRTVHIRRCRAIDPQGILDVGGIPVVRPATALLQIAEQMTPAGLKYAYLAADMKALLSDDDLAWLIAPKPGHKGASYLRELVLKRIPEVGKTKSVLEALTREVIAEAGLPPPEINALVGKYRVDFYWPDLDLIVEADGIEFHRGVAKRLDDQLRENELVAAGNAVLRFNWNRVVNERGQVKEQLRAAHRSRRNRGH